MDQTKSGLILKMNMVKSEASLPRTNVNVTAIQVSEKPDPFFPAAN